MRNLVQNPGMCPMDYLAQARNLRDEAEQAEDRNNDRLAHRLRALAIECEARAYRVENELRRVRKAKRAAIVASIFGGAQ